MSEMICVVKKLNERAKKIKKTKKRPKEFKYTSSQCKTTHFIRKRLSTKINRKLLKDKHFVPKKDDSKETSGLARKKSGYLDSCSAASTASPSSLGHVKVGLLPTRSPALPFQTQLPHAWTASKKTPNAMLLEKLLAKPIPLAPLGINQSQLLLPGLRNCRMAEIDGKGTQGSVLAWRAASFLLRKLLLVH